MFGHFGVNAYSAWLNLMARPTSSDGWTARKLPDGKVLIPGVIDSTTNFIEHPELVAQRIEQFAEVVGRENVIAGTDCGFSTGAGSMNVDPGIVWAKFRSMAEGAEIASKRLWK